MDKDALYKKMLSGEELTIDEQLFLINEIDKELDTIQKENPQAYEAIQNMIDSFVDYQESDQD